MSQATVCRPPSSPRFLTAKSTRFTMVCVAGWGGGGGSGESSAIINIYFILLLLQSFSLTAERLLVSQKKGKSSLFGTL